MFEGYRVREHLSGLMLPSTRFFFSLLLTLINRQTFLVILIYFAGDE